METSPLMTEIEAFRKKLMFDFLTFISNHPPTEPVEGQVIADLITKAYNATIKNALPVPEKRQPSDLVLLAKLWPTLDEPLKMMLSQVAADRLISEGFSSVGYLSNWMLTTKSDRYALFVEVLREIALQASQDKDKNPEVNTEVKVLGTCEYQREYSSGRKTCRQNALFVETEAHEVINGKFPAGLKTCQHHHDRLTKGTLQKKERQQKQESRKQSTEKTSTPRQIPIAIEKPTPKQHAGINQAETMAFPAATNRQISRCEIAVGDNLLNLKQCGNEGCKSHSILSSPRVNICHEHQSLIEKVNPKDSKGFAFVDSQTPVRLFDETSHDFKPISLMLDYCPVACQAQSCESSARYINGYGALVCHDHAFNQLKNSVVPCDSKITAFKEKTDNVPELKCQISVGDNLLKLESCERKAYGPMNNGKGPVVCLDHRRDIHLKNTLLGREKGHPICEVTPLTPIKLKVADHELQRFSFVGIFEKQVQCQIIDRMNGPCSVQAYCQTVYGALICDQHRAMLKAGNDKYLTVPREAKVVPFVAEKPKEKSAAVKNLQPCQAPDPRGGGFLVCGVKTTNRVEGNNYELTAICVKHHRELEQRLGQRVHAPPKMNLDSHLNSYPENQCKHYDLDTEERCPSLVTDRSYMGVPFCAEHRQSYKPIPAQQNPCQVPVVEGDPNRWCGQLTSEKDSNGKSICLMHLAEADTPKQPVRESAEKTKERLGYPLCNAQLLGGRGPCEKRAMKDSQQCSVHSKPKPLQLKPGITQEGIEATCPVVMTKSIADALAEIPSVPSKVAETSEQNFEPCQVVANATGQMCGMGTTNRVEKDGKVIAMCSSHHLSQRRQAEYKKSKAAPTVAMEPCQMVIRDTGKFCGVLTTNRVGDEHVKDVPICEIHEKYRQEKIKTFKLKVEKDAADRQKQAKSRCVMVNGRDNTICGSDVNVEEFCGSLLCEAHRNFINVALRTNSRPERSTVTEKFVSELNNFLTAEEQFADDQ